ncbi:MAG: sigma-70 family RNA polymerase sigma factor [Planctomycetota bacterium]
MPSADLASGIDEAFREKLLGEARCGSMSAFGQLLEIYRPYLQMVAEAELSSEIRPKVSASDLVQDSFLEAQVDFPDFRGTTDAEFRGWLRQVLIHNLKNAARFWQETEKRNVWREERDLPLAEQTAGSEKGPTVLAMQREESVRLQAGLLSLPEHFQQVIFLRGYERLPFEEIGLRMQRTADAARKLWVRAVEQLQQVLAESGGHDGSEA